MKGNKSVESLTICLESVLLEERDQVFAVMATSGDWSSIQKLELSDDIKFEEPLSLREAEHISSFIVQSENIRTLSLKGLGDENIEPIMETLSRTKVQSLKIRFCKPIFTLLENKGSCRYIVALFLAHKEAELSWNKSYLGNIERCVNVDVKLDYNIKVSALRSKELHRFSFECSDFGLRCSHLAGLQS